MMWMIRKGLLITLMTVRNREGLERAEVPHLSLITIKELTTTTSIPLLKTIPSSTILTILQARAMMQAEEVKTVLNREVLYLNLRLDQNLH